MEAYFENFGYHAWLVKKFPWFIDEGPCEDTYKAASRYFQRRLYRHRHVEPPVITIPWARIPAPIVGQVYDTAWDFIDKCEDHLDNTPGLPGKIFNSRYGTYCFYQKEIPKIVRQLGYPIKEVKLLSELNKGVEATGWEIMLNKPVRPLLIY